MNTKKLRSATLFTALALFIFAVTGVCVSLFPAQAETYNASALFTAGANSSVSGEANRNVAFSFNGNSGNSVSYNRDLAYKWYAKAEADSAPVANYFSAEFSFVNVTFETFTVSFQSAENSKSADGVTVNEIVFFNDNGNYSVAFRNNDDKEVADEDLTKTSVTAFNDIEIEFGAGSASGEYAVTVAVGEDRVPGVFTNIRGAYANYSASTLVPLTFSATVPEGSAATEVSFRSLNGQSFLLNGEGRVTDDTAPVLVVDDEIKSFTLGTRLLDFSYEIIDVCDSTVTRSATYYQYNPQDSESAYVSLTSDARIFDKYTYADEGMEYVSVKFELSDDDSNSATYYLAWYAEDSADVYSKTVGADAIDFLAVSRDDEAPIYAWGNGSYEENQAYLSYADAVAEAAADLRAGEGYSFYLPSLEDLISDNNTPYTGLSFTVYYRTEATDSTSTRSALSYDELEIPVASVGEYQFKVIAADKQGNRMRFDSDGRQVSVDADNVWDLDNIPLFGFKVENKGVEVEETEELSYAYMYSNYSVDPFTIKGLSGYQTEYKLFYLDGVSFNDISYTALVDFANYCYQNDIRSDDFLEELLRYENKQDLAASASLHEIHAYNGNGPTSEDDEGWDTHDNRYQWRESAMTFTPQENGYYIVSLDVADRYAVNRVYAYRIIYAASEVDAIDAPSYWIENNVVTVVFIVIAVLSAIAIVVVLAIKPSEEAAEKSESDIKSSAKELSGKNKNKK